MEQQHPLVYATEPVTEIQPVTHSLTVVKTPLSTPTMVVVSAELQMVHQNMVKLRTIPMTSEMSTAEVKPMDLEPCRRSDHESEGRSKWRKQGEVAMKRNL